MRKTNKKQWAN